MPSRPFSQRRGRGSLRSAAQGGEIRPAQPLAPPYANERTGDGCRARGAGWRGSSRWGSRWRWRCCCWSPARRGRGKYAVAQCGWYVGADAELGRHDRWRQVPPRRLVRAARRRRPLRRRPPEELHPRRPGHRLRHPLRPLALGGPGGDRHLPGARHLVARAPRRHRAADRRRQLERRLRRLCRRRRRPTSPRASSSPASTPPSRRSRTGCSAPGRRPSGARLEPGSWSALRALTITVQDDQAPAAGIGGDLLAGGWRRGTQGVGFWGGETGGGIRFGETSLDGARVNLTEYPCAKALIGGVWRATQMRPCLLGVSGQRRDRHHPLQRRPAQRPPLRRSTSPATSAARRTRRSRSTTTRRRTPANLALAGGERLAPRRRLRPLLGQPRPGPGEPDLGRLLADHRARRLRHRRQVRAGATTSPRLPTASSPRPASTPCTSGCATKPATTPRPRRSRCRCASTTCRPASPSR